MKQQEEDAASDEPFPAGMRVLVVDDDSACLRVMENLLHICKYRVWTTNKGKEALRILKDSENKFDIVLSDVQMPDMDGIKLLQLVGLEMNIPVIMLSSHSDQKMVMQGIRNGACDYLVKPVRVQELQNIWQHVVRRNKSITLKRPNPSPVETDRHKGKKRIEESSTGGDDEPEPGENEPENEETNRKKTRLFWSVELHQQFVDAVNSLGLEKAFPKKILDLMNIQGLTREKVASHLQKYRLYLQKVNDGSSRNMTMSGYDDVHMGPVRGYGVFRSVMGFNSGLSNPSPFGQLNSSSGLSIRDRSSSPMLQTSQHHNSFGHFGRSIPSQGLSSRPQNMPTFLNAPSNSIMSSQNATQFGNQVTGSNNWGSYASPKPFQRNLFTSNVSAGVIAPPMPRAQTVQNDYFSGFSSGNGNGNGFKENLQVQNHLNGYGAIAPPMTPVQNVQNDYFSGFSSGNAVNTNFLGHSEIWQGQKPDNVLNSCNRPAADQTLSQNNANWASPLEQLEGACTPFQQQNADLFEPNFKFDDFLLDDAKLIAGSSNGGGGSEYLEDIVGSFLKQNNGEMAPAAAGDDFDDLFTS